jgi:hypothetical protein
MTSALTKKPTSDSSSGSAAVRDTGADGDVLLAAEARQQRVEGREQAHEERRPLAPRQGPHGVGDFSGDRHSLHPSAEALHRRTRSIGRHVQRGRQRRETRAPIGQLALEALARERFALPPRKVGVLDRQVGQRAGPAGGECLVQRGHLAHQHPHRPSVRHDVMHGEQKDVFVLGQTDQPGADQRSPLEIERRGGFLTRAALCRDLPLGGGQVREIDDGQLDAGGVFDDLRRSAGSGLEARAQAFVPALDFLQAPLQDAAIPARREAAARGERCRRGSPDRSGG